MIVGEAEVQGQVKRAYELALEAGTTGPLTNRLFRAALQTGKRVRSETAISQRRVSVSSVAVGLARETLGDLAQRRVVILGTGETSELTARALAEQGVRTIFVANRRRDRALAAGGRFGGRVVGFDDLPRELERADIVVASTASPHPIVGHDELALVMAARDGRPLLLIDIAVPRDVDPLCAELAGVTLYDIDDLQAVVARNLKVRQAEARQAEGIIEEEIQRFAGWLGSLEVLPTIAALRARGDEIVAGVLAENAGRWEALSERDRERVEAMARTVMNRLLHEPTLRMKRTGEERMHARMQVLRELFGLEDARERPEPEAAGRRRGAGALPRRPRPATLGARGDARQRAGAGAGAGAVADALGGAEIVPVVDRRATAARRGGGQVALGDELERALLAGEIDVAVHSAKDVPGELPDGLAIVAVPARADARDALCGAGSLDDLPAGARVGTSSLRRRPSCAPRATTSRSSTCAATSTRGCASSPRASATRSCSRSPGSSGWAARRRGRRRPRPATFVPAPGQGALALEAARTTTTPAPRLRALTDAPPRTPACAPSARSCPSWARAATRRSAPTPAPPAEAR